MSNIAVIGAGSWGTALAIVAARGESDGAEKKVKLWSRSADIVNAINQSHRHPRHLIDVDLPINIRATSDAREALDCAEIAIFVVPSHTARQTLCAVREFLSDKTLIVSATKGIEVESGLSIAGIVEQEFGTTATHNRFACLSGPSFAAEVAVDQPTAVVAASVNPSVSEQVQTVLSTGNFRVYTNTDVAGVELGGAIKNIIALACGMIAGLGLGSNSIAGLITRGLAEMSRFALTHGARPETLNGLAGLGDLVLTATGKLSRNRFVGQEIGRGRTLEEVLSEMNEVAEGVLTTRAIKKIADAKGIEMPITSAVNAVLHEGKRVSDAIEEVMRRPLRTELDAM